MRDRLFAVSVTVILLFKISLPNVRRFIALINQPLVAQHFLESGMSGFVNTFRFVAIASTLTLVSFSAMADEKKPTEKVTYIDHVQPIFRAKCFACHNPDKKSGGLILTNFTSMMLGGSSGAVIEPGDPDSSYLWNLVNHDATPEMPPKSDKMAAPILATIKKWIEGGALETKGSKSLVKKKAKMQFALSFAPTERPPGPPSMPNRMSLEPVIHTEKTTTVTALATSPWAPLAAVAGQKQVLLYNTKSLDLVGVLPFPEGIPHVLKFSRSGQLLMAAGGTGASSGRCIVWNVKTGERVVEVGDEYDTVLGADISGDQTMIALGGPQKMIRVYSAQTGEKLYETKKHTDWITSISFSPDGVLLATGDRNGGTFVWEAETGREYLGLKGHTKRIRGFAWRIDSNVLASASEDSTVRLWEMENGRQLRSIGAHGGGTMGVWFTRDGNIATTGRDRTTKLWNQAGAAIRTFEAFPDLSMQVAFCDETKRVIAGDFTGLVRVWESGDGKRVGELSTNPKQLAALLAQATAQLAVVQVEHKKQADAYAAVQAAYAKTTADVAAKNALVTTYTAAEKTAQAKLVETQKVVVDATAKATAANTVVNTLKPLIPALKEAAAKGDLAVAQAKTDAQLVAAVTQLKAIATARETTFTAATTAATAEAARLKTAQALVTATQTAITTAKTNLANTQKAIVALKATVVAQQAQVAAAKTVADKATGLLASAQAGVKKWQDEIAFTKQLAEFKTKQSQVDELVAVFDEADAELKAAQGKITAAQAKITAGQAAKTAATAAVTVGQTKATTLTSQRDAQAKVIATREGAVAALTDASAKGAVAAAALPADKELATAAGQLKAAFDRNNKAIADGKVALAAATKVVATAQAEVVALQAKVKAADVLIAATTKELAAAQAAMVPVAAKAAKAKATADQARAGLLQLKQKLDALQKPAPTTTAQAS
jgi:WD40 repeat protein